MFISNNKNFIGFNLLLIYLMLSVPNLSNSYHVSFSKFFTLRRILVVSGIALVLAYKLIDVKKNIVKHDQLCECDSCVSLSNINEAI